MADTRDLWWAAGRLAFPVPTTGPTVLPWADSVRRAALLLEPVWPKEYSAGPFTDALPTVALLLYAGFGAPLGEKPVETVLAALGSGPPTTAEHVVREGLAERGHDLADESPVCVLFRRLTQYHPPVTETSSGLELPAADQWPGGTMMDAASQWAARELTRHHAGVGASGR